MNYNKYNNNILKGNKKKINIVEVNFDEPKELFKEEDELKTIIKKIKENRMNFLSERNNRPLEKNKSFKRFQISDSDVCLDNNSMYSTPMMNKAKNIGNYFSYNKIIKDELQNYNSFNYLNYINNSKKVVDMRKMNIIKKKGLYGSLID